MANRVQHIQDLLPSTKWRHVPTAENSADLASRGVTTSDLITSTLWWSGPPWLSLPPHKWPVTMINRPKEAVTVLTVAVSMDIETQQSRFLDYLWEKFSSANTLVRVVAWILRFINNARRGSTKTTSNVISHSEIHQRKTLLFTLAQRQSFPEVFAAIKTNKSLHKIHPLYKTILTLDN